MWGRWFEDQCFNHLEFKTEFRICSFLLMSSSTGSFPGSVLCDAWEAVGHAAACPPLIVLCMDPLTFCPGRLLPPNITVAARAPTVRWLWIRPGWSMTVTLHIHHRAGPCRAGSSAVNTNSLRRGGETSRLGGFTILWGGRPGVMLRDSVRWAEGHGPERLCRQWVLTRCPWATHRAPDEHRTNTGAQKNLWNERKVSNTRVRL